MPAKPWTETLTEKHQGELYQVYEALFRTSLSISCKQRSFEAAIDGAHSWSINHATTAALVHFCTTGSCDGLRRAHQLDRKERALAMFEEPQDPMVQRELFQYFFEHDAVVLATKGENKKGGQLTWGTLFKIPQGLFFLPGMKAVGKREELAWAIEELKQAGVPFAAHRQ